MNLLEQFVDFLKNQKNKPSFLTVKNYKADVRQFIIWFEKEFNSVFDPSKVTSQIISRYKKFSNLSPNSMERHVSSLHKFFNFLKIIGKIDFSLFAIQEIKEKIIPDPWMLRNFKSFLYDCKKSKLTIKNYINDVKSFSIWFTEASLLKYTLNVTEKNLLWKLNSSILEEYKQRLISSNFSPRTINRKLSSLRNYINWAKSQGLTSSDHTEFSPAIPNIQKEFYAPLDMSVNYLPVHKKVWHYIRYVRPKWYKKYNSYSIVHYFHFAILVILSSAVGFGLYNGIFADIQRQNSVLAEKIISPLADSNLTINPINQTEDVVASESGTFTKLNFNLVQPAQTLSLTELIASSSAGKAFISSGQTEVTIINTLVTGKSLIYLTPVGTPSAQSPFLIRQTPQESFTVGVQSPTPNPISFNWLIVN